MAIPLVWIGLAAAGVYLLGSKPDIVHGTAVPPKKPPPPKPVPYWQGPLAPWFPPGFNGGNNIGQGSGSANANNAPGPQPFVMPPALGAVLAGLGAGQAQNQAAHNAMSAVGPQGAPPVNPFGLGADAGPAAKLQPVVRYGTGVAGKLNVPSTGGGSLGGSSLSAAKAAELNLFG